MVNDVQCGIPRNTTFTGTFKPNCQGSGNVWELGVDFCSPTVALGLERNVENVEAALRAVCGLDLGYDDPLDQTKKSSGRQKRAKGPILAMDLLNALDKKGVKYRSNV